MRAPLQVPPPRILLVVLVAIVVLVFAWGKAAHAAAPPDEIRQVIELINQERARHGLHPLMHDPRLDVAAQRHSDDEAEHDFIGHDGTDGSTFWSRAVDVGFDPQVLGEVLAAGNNTAASAVDSWFHSPPHYEILMYPDLDWIGVGHSIRPGTHYTHYWVGEVGVSGNPLPMPSATSTPSLPYPPPYVTATPGVPPTPFPPEIVARLRPRLFLPDLLGGDSRGPR